MRSHGFINLTQRHRVTRRKLVPRIIKGTQKSQKPRNGGTGTCFTNNRSQQ